MGPGITMVPRDYKRVPLLGGPGTTIGPGAHNRSWDDNRAWGPQEGPLPRTTKESRHHNGAVRSQYGPGTTIGSVLQEGRGTTRGPGTTGGARTLMGHGSATGHGDHNEILGTTIRACNTTGHGNRRGPENHKSAQ